MRVNCIGKGSAMGHGHDPALVYNPVADCFDEVKVHGLAFGLNYNFEYEELKRTVDPGRLSIIGTDELC